MSFLTENWRSFDADDGLMIGEPVWFNNQFGYVKDTFFQKGISQLPKCAEQRKPPFPE